MKLFTPPTPAAIIAARIARLDRQIEIFTGTARAIARKIESLEAERAGLVAKLNTPDS